MSFVLGEFWDLFIAFIRASNLGFGGGPAVIPLIQTEAVNNYHWITNEQFVDALAVTNALPGPIATKLAGYIGYQVLGWPGVLAALLGTIGPTTLAIVLLTNILMKYTDSPGLKGALKGVRPVVVVLVAQTAFEMGLESFPNIITWAIAAVTAASLFWFKIHPAILIVLSLIFGLLVFQ
jgi:chromate transporter